MENRQFDFLLSRPFLLSAAFLIGLFVCEIVFFSQSRETFALAAHYKYGNYPRIIAVIFLTIVSIVLTGFFLWAAFASPYKYRIVYFVVFCLAIFVEYGYQNAFGRFTVFEDVGNAFIAADRQIAQNAVGMYFNFWALIPCLIFAVFLLSAKPTLKKGLTFLAVSMFLFAGFFSLTSYFTRNSFITASPAAFFRTAFDFPVNWYFGSIYQAPRRIFYNQTRQEITFRADKPPTNNIVFIVDESVRGDHLSLNGYERPTTVFLDELNKKGFVKNWGLAVSGTTCSMTSNNLLLTGLNKLPDFDFNVYKLPTVFQYAKAAGYKTMYIDGQVSNVWSGKPSDNSFIDERLTINDFKNINALEIDREIARLVKNLTENSTGNFVWINKSGVHKPYHSAYPPTAAIYLPVADADDSRGYYDLNVSREAIVNDYDNAVRYNSNIFFTNLVGEQIGNDTFFVYTSDHGQTLRENGKIVSHCSDSKPEATVPLFVVAAPENLPAADTAFKAAHSNIFATLLDLMNFPENERKYDYAVSLFKAKAADSQPRFYFSGDLHNDTFGGKYLYDGEDK